LQPTEKGSTVYRRYGKRALDLVLSAIGLAVLSPLLVIVAILVRWKMGVPVLFRQQRPGLLGKLFTLIKFRTMTGTRDAQGVLLPDAQRLTALGRWLRATSLDELPELLNVLKGEMSLIGPRPLLTQYLDRYTPEQARRHEVRPGITGWAQINGRQNVLFSRRLELDRWYVDHLTFGLDIKILLLTLPNALLSRGVISGQNVTEVDDLGLARALEPVRDSNDVEY
jgi:sugar transferase EpsL